MCNSCDIQSPRRDISSNLPIHHKKLIAQIHGSSKGAKELCQESLFFRNDESNHFIVIRHRIEMDLAQFDSTFVLGEK